MGGDDHEGFSADGEGPVRDVRLDAFLIDATAVTGEQFSEFVKSTGYVTEAEHFGWSFVFHLFVEDLKDGTTFERPDDTPWWLAVPGACWREPEGPGSNLRDRLDHPVVHVSWADALAYCRWAGTRLPSEAEWEYAARGGLNCKRYPWGDNLRPNKAHHCNIWQGAFPTHNRGDDGYLGTAPVNSYQPNRFGLYNVAGNVWEWCEDWFSPRFHVKGPRVNPKGPPRGSVKVIRGGSYLCHKSYCNRYRVGARTANTPDSSTANSGFRCARDV